MGSPPEPKLANRSPLGHPRTARALLSFPPKLFRSASMLASTNVPGHSTNDSAFQDIKRWVRSACPQPLLNWREQRFYAQYGEVELHLIDILCRRGADSIDV